MHATMVGYNIKRKFLFLPSISSPKNTHVLSILFSIIVNVSPSFSLQLKRNSFQSPPSDLGEGLHQSSSSPAELVLVLG